MNIVRRILIGFIALIILISAAAAIGLPIVKRASYPQVEGEINLPGLEGPVDVYRDSFGVPHIYATTEHDLFMAQGYVQSQERFWQMDFWRHQAVGRLSELLGSNTVEIDKYLQTMGWERVALEEWALLDSASKNILLAFTEGINAYLDTHSGSEISFEYMFLPIINPDYTPQAWQPHHSLAWAKAMAWDLRGNMDSEIDRALLLADLTSQEVAMLYPEYDFDNHPVIVNDPHIQGEASVPGQVQIPEGSRAALARVNAGFKLLDSLRGGNFEGIGSNSWAISGDLSATGMPLLANDPHLAKQIPSIWFEVGLHCVARTPDCNYNVAGFAFSSTPGVIIGHNENIAWGFTNMGPDVMDLYIEKINPENPDQYEVNGEWVDMELTPITINVAGGEPVSFTARSTRHGPIMSDVSLSDFNENAGIELPENYAISLKWTALQPSFIFRSIWKINRATNWEEFRDASRDFSVPAQNLIYADVDGNIGYQSPGRLPARNPWHDGMLPVPGWTDEYEWIEFIPFEWHPFAFNPPEGYIVTANNAVVGPEYPFTLSREWDQGYRAQAILDDILNAGGPIDIPYIQQMHGNNRDINAENLVPILLELSFDTDKQEEAQALLANWDYQANMDSAPAAIFQAFWKNLLKMSFGDNLPDYFQPWGSADWYTITRQLAEQPDHPWWDDVNTTEIEDRDMMFKLAFASAVSELEDTLGGRMENWSWGDLHTLSLEHGVMNNFPIINQLFNEGPFPTSGGSSIVNATGWSANSDGYGVSSLPSMRMIVDLGNLQNSLTIHSTGQSGHAGHDHYIDMVDPWRTIEYHILQWDFDAVQQNAEHHIVFSP